jgi:hypothetical protein
MNIEQSKGLFMAAFLAVLPTSSEVEQEASLRD